jgi:multisubunit Na+/H+ antiporter MnhF subunit
MNRSTKNAFTNALGKKSNNTGNYILEFIHILFLSHSFVLIVWSTCPQVYRIILSAEIRDNLWTTSIINQHIYKIVIICILVEFSIMLYLVLGIWINHKMNVFI